MVAVDRRLSAAKVWLSETLGYEVSELAVVSGDASFRRYFRAQIDKGGKAISAVLMDAPPAKEDVGPFIRIANQLAGYGVLAPQILEQNLEQGFLLISDLGNEIFFDRVQALKGSTDVLYPQALRALADLQIAAHKAGDAEGLPKYDITLLSNECQLFDDWLVQKHLGQQLPQDVAANVTAILEAVQEQPYGFVHRDYHSRNLMVVGDELAMIDFQDAVFGPVTYDAVSLLKDAYIRLKPEKIQQWLQGYHQQLAEEGLVSTDFKTFQRWFDWMGLQRHIKVAGIFCRLNYRDDKAAYMQDIPLVLDYITEAAERYPELSALHRYVADVVKPEFG